MKLAQATIPVLCGLMTLTPFWTSGNVPARADTQAPKAIDVSLSLDTPSVIEAGEPIILRYKMMNTLEDQTVGAYTGRYKTSWYSLSLRNVSGQSTATGRHEQSPDPGGLQATETSTFAPGGDESGYIVASSALVAAHPGRYTLTAHVDVHYAALNPTEHNSFVIKSTIAASDAHFVRDYTFPITLTAPVSSHLAFRAETLRKGIQVEQDNTKLTALLDALFAMPESEAAPSWTALANNPRRMHEENIADELAGLRTTKAIDLLVQMSDNLDLPYATRYYIKTDIDKAYNLGNPDIRSHIKSIATGRGLEMPDQVAIPQAAD